METVRQLMIQHGLHFPKIKKTKVHRSRPRRENFGELIQTDASIHDWFEGHRGPCALIVYIDDASGKITSLQFHESDALKAIFRVLKHIFVSTEDL